MQLLRWVYIWVAVVLLFGAAVLVHELGHFWIARHLHLKVEGFSIGFGPKLFGWTHNGVEYAWRLIPAGGFVALPQMAALEGREGKRGPAERLPAVSAGARILVALAGPLMNVVFAFVIASAIYFLGLPVLVNPAIIGAVEAGSREAKLGIRAGDRVVAVNGKLVKSWEEVQMTTAMARTNVLAVTIERNGVRTVYRLEARMNPELGLKLLNLEPSEHPVIAKVFSGSAAEQAGLKSGDEVLSFNRVPIVGQEQLVNLIKKRTGQPCQIEARRGQQHLALTVVPRLNSSTGNGMLGVMVAPNATTVYQVQKPGPEPWRLIAQVCGRTFDTFGALLHSKQTGVGVNDLSGPPGILAMLAVEVKTDYRLALKFMVLLDVSLAILNLLPLPLLDGGHIAMAILEKLRGRPLSQHFQRYATLVFTGLLIYFMVYISYNDIVRHFPLFESMFEQHVKFESRPERSVAPAH